MKKKQDEKQSKFIDNYNPFTGGQPLTPEEQAAAKIKMKALEEKKKRLQVEAKKNQST